MNGGKRVTIEGRSKNLIYGEPQLSYNFKPRNRRKEPVDETWVPNPRAIAGSLESTPPAYRALFKDFEQRMAKRGILVRGS